MKFGAHLYKHGHRSNGNKPTRAYYAWSNMRARCNSLKRPDYKHYGGRGITIDPCWNDYTNFLSDMGEPPIGMSLDRIDNSKGYSKDNCRWANWTQQARNRRPQRNDSTGVTGVSWDKHNKKYIAYFSRENKLTVLYRGKDFFDACCARKSWENQSI